MGVILRQTAGSYFPKCAGSYFPFTACAVEGKAINKANALNNTNRIPCFLCRLLTINSLIG